MLQIIIAAPDVKAFMNILFKGNAFDGFETREAVVASRMRFEITGELSGEEQKKYAPWSEVKPYIISFIKGKKPTVMRIIFSAAGDIAAGIDPNAAALFLNMNYDGDALRFTTATSQKTFALTKELDQKWESYIKTLFTGLNIKIEYE